MAYAWLSVILASAAGSITALILYGLTQQRRVRLIITVLSVTVLTGLGAHYFFTPYYKVFCLRQQLQQHVVFKHIAHDDPVLFQRFFLAARPAALRARDPQALTDAVENMTQRALALAIGQASDASIQALLNLKLTLYQDWSAQNAPLILQFEFPAAFPNASSQWPATTALQATTAAEAALIMSATENSQVSSGYAEVRDLISPILARLNTQYGTANVKLVFGQPAAATLDAAIAARLLIDFYSQVLQLPPSDAGNVIRFMQQENQ